MRIFLGIDPGDASRDELASLCVVLRDATPEWRGEKWVPRGNLHLTLRFLGEVEPDTAPAIRDALAQSLSAHSRFDISVLVPVEAVPAARRARMLWARYDDPAGRCRRLAADVDDVLITFGIPPEPRPFVPHVTLVRARSPRRFSLPDAFIIEPVNPMSVHEVTLFSSTLTRTGPVYERIERIALGVR